MVTLRSAEPPTQALLFARAEAGWTTAVAAAVAAAVLPAVLPAVDGLMLPSEAHPPHLLCDGDTGQASYVIWIRGLSVAEAAAAGPKGAPPLYSGTKAL